MQVVGDEPNHHRESRMSATDGNGVEGAEPHARSQCGTLRGLAPAIYMTGARAWALSAAERGGSTTDRKARRVPLSSVAMPKAPASTKAAAAAELARRRAREGAEAGNADAQYALGLMCKAGRGVPQNFIEAVAWFRKAAEQGHADAQTTLGQMYDNGDGVLQDSVEAVAWYRRAAEQRNADRRSPAGWSGPQ